MSTFISQSACKGCAPKHIATYRHIPRPSLVSRMLRERQVARFLVAPAGYGKTAAALEYARIVFAFEQVVWLDCTSPCFLRDLDKGIIVQELAMQQGSPALVVFEDLPPLDSARAEGLSREMDALLAAGCEVVATCVPTCDCLAAWQTDRLKVPATDLLLAEGELADNPPSGGKAGGAVPLAERVASLCWPPAKGGSLLLAGMVAEELPADVLLVAATMLVLQEGRLADIAAFGRGDEATVRLLAESYPHLGIDLRDESFCTARFAVGDLAMALSGRLPSLASCSLLGTEDGLSAGLADALLARGKADRACQLLSLLASRSARLAWLVRCNVALLDAGCLAAALDLCTSAGPVRAQGDCLAPAFQCLRLSLAGWTAPAQQLAAEVASCATADEDALACVALVMLRSALPAQRKGGVRVLENVIALPNDPAEYRAWAAARAQAGSFWWVLGAVGLALAASPAAGVRAWEACVQAHLSPQALLLSAAWVLDAACSAQAAGEGMAASLSQVVAFARLHGRSLCAQGSCGLFAARALVALERAIECGLTHVAVDARSLLAAHRMQMAFLAQRGGAEGSLALQPSPQVASARHERANDLVVAGAGQAGLAPLLTVNLFGGLDVRMGGRPLDPALFRRQKVKTLLALLVLNQGREYSRDRLVKSLWPESDLLAARKNLYSISSQLRRALSIPEGGCPYLIRERNSLRIDARMLETDVARFGGLCEALQFNDPGDGGWAALASEVSERFAEDLLPSETESDRICEARVSYRNRLMDALVTASRRLTEAGQAQQGLWFARAALQRDRTREDAYTTLMGCQLEAGQRTAALETYFACRRFLLNELGIDPSAETMRLYRAVIETEASLG